MLVIPHAPISLDPEALSTELSALSYTNGVMDQRTGNPRRAAHCLADYSFLQRLHSQTTYLESIHLGLCLAINTSSSPSTLPKEGRTQPTFSAALQHCVSCPAGQGRPELREQFES